MKNNYVQLVAIVWLLATIASFGSNSVEPVEYAFWFSVIAGIAYIVR